MTPTNYKYYRFIDVNGGEGMFVFKPNHRSRCDNINQIQSRYPKIRFIKISKRKFEETKDQYHEDCVYL